jgi:hypothetical protein
MSYMGYYFYPDAMDSIAEESGDKTKRRGHRSKLRTILSHLTAPLARRR